MTKKERKFVLFYTLRYFLTALDDPIIPTTAPINRIKIDILKTIADGGKRVIIFVNSFPPKISYTQK